MAKIFEEKIDLKNDKNYQGWLKKLKEKVENKPKVEEVTPEERRALIEMVKRWRSHQDLRFGQWLWYIVGRDPFQIEGDELAQKMEEYFTKEGFEVG